MQPISCQGCTKAASQCGGCPRVFAPAQAQSVMANLLALPDSTEVQNLGDSLASVMPKAHGTPGDHGLNVLGDYQIVCSDTETACVVRADAVRLCDTEIISVETLTGITPE